MDPKTISICERIIQENEPNLSDGTIFPGLVELGYWGAQSVVAVNDCLRALTFGDSIHDRDGLYGQAILSHNRRALAYWKSIAQFHETNYWIAEQDHVNDFEISRLSELRTKSKGKLMRLESHFPKYGSELAFEPGVMPLDLFKNMLSIYPNGTKKEAEIDPQFAELVYWTAENTVAVSKCLRALEKDTPQNEKDELYAQAYKTHGGRAVAFWEAMHYFNLHTYTELTEGRGSQAIRDEQFRKVQLSHKKMSKALARYEDYQSEEKLDRKLLDSHIQRT